VRTFESSWPVNTDAVKTVNSQSFAIRRLSTQTIELKVFTASVITGHSSTWTLLFGENIRVQFNVFVFTADTVNSTRIISRNSGAELTNDRWTRTPWRLLTHNCPPFVDSHCKRTWLEDLHVTVSVFSSDSSTRPALYLENVRVQFTVSVFTADTMNSSRMFSRRSGDWVATNDRWTRTQ
jgi:hypothetical protein